MLEYSAYAVGDMHKLNMESRLIVLPKYVKKPKTFHRQWFVKGFWFFNILLFISALP